MLQGCQAVAEKYFLPVNGIRDMEYDVEENYRIPVPMRDGINLYADIYHPITDKNIPTILVRIPYSLTLTNSVKSEAIARFWARRGYHVVIQATRGRYQSEGEFYPLRNERNDGVDTLNWLSSQAWYDGRLGMWGGSAFGHTQWVLADQENPGPKALNIQISSTSNYDMFYPGGGFSLESALFWAIRSKKANGKIANQHELNKGYSGFSLLEADNRAYTDISYFNDWVRHTERDNYWSEIDGVDRAKNVKAPVLLAAGWFDPYLPSQLRDFKTIRSSENPVVANKSRLIIGPWAHATSVKLPGKVKTEDYRQAVLANSIDWFDRILKFEKHHQKPTFPVKIYVMGENVWRNEHEWPLQRAKYTSYYLLSAGDAGHTLNGELSLRSSKENLKEDSYIYDPKNPVQSAGGAVLGFNAGIKLQNNIEQRPDVLVYTTPKLKQATEVTGPIKVVLYVTTTALSTDFTAKLVDVHPDGSAYNVTDGLLRKKYRPQIGRLHKQEPEKIEIELWPTSMVFKEGHQIRLEISSSNYPRYDRNPNTGNKNYEEDNPVSAKQSIFHGERYHSRIILPIIERS